MSLVINGRFLTQAMTGVQRFATEVTRALDDLAQAGEIAPPRVLAPSGAADSPFHILPMERFGRRGGQLWEQLELPGRVGADVLVSLGNTAPLRVGRRQAIVIHDAGVFDTPESYSWQFRAWYKALHKALALRGARLLTVSEFSRSRLVANLGVRPERVGVLPEGGEHILRHAPDAAVLAKHGLAPGGYALTVGTRAAHKNLGGLAEAAALLAARGKVLAAVGSVNQDVFRNAAGVQGPTAQALGRVTDSELRTLYENALCLIFPSRYEGFGLPPVEAMCCRCPVVAAKAGAVPEVCADAALWFDTTKPETLVAALTQLLDEPGLADAMRARGTARAALYTWPQAARALLRHVQDIG